MWESTVRLVGDDEAAHRALTQLKKAIRSRVTETELPEGSQLQLVSQTTSTVTAQLGLPEWSVTPSDRGFSIRGERTGGGGHKPSLPPVLTGATRRQRGTDQRERLRSSRPSGATDTVYRVRGPGGWDGQVGLQALQTHCAPKKPVTASELTSQEV